MNEATKKENNFIKGVLKAVLLGIVIFSALILLISAFFYFFKIKEDFIPITFNIILFASAFLVGIFSSKNALSKGYLRGLASGILFIGFTVLLFLIFKKTIVGKDGISYTIMLLLSFFGGILGINSQ